MAASGNESDRRLEADLAEIRKAISHGQTEEATKRLLGVSYNCVPGTTHSQEVGDLFMELGFAAMAGRYWYLLENKTDRMTAVCQEFEHSLGDDPGLIAQCFFRPLLSSPFAITKLEDLWARAKDLRQEYKYDVKPPARGLRDTLGLLGCGIVAFVVMFVFIMGVVFIGSWFR